MNLEIRNIRTTGDRRVCLYLGTGGWKISRLRIGMDAFRLGVWTDPVQISENIARRLIRRAKRLFPLETK